MSRTATALQKFGDGYNCAQAVIYSFSDEREDDDKDLLLKLACGFGAGMGRKEIVCGAVSGGIMALGMKYGRGENKDGALTERTYRKTRELMDKFVEKYGTVICRELLGGCELTTPEGQREFREKDLKNKVCKDCVRAVVEIIENISLSEE